MDLFLAVVAIVMTVGLAYVGVMEWRKGTHENRLFMIETLVAAAQQLYGDDPGAIRYSWVAERVKDRWPDVDEKQLESLIEAAVYRLKVFAGRVPSNGQITDDLGGTFWMGNRQN